MSGSGPNIDPDALPEYSDVHSYRSLNRMFRRFQQAMRDTIDERGGACRFW
ncbi:hypothetical protein [Oceanisphaera psychrotolerans]|uniref:hypothetical protein n=1 Tax=Oceanisphaera psychrotolerans TaxID=1414654 RepID=UPI001587EBE7|nr:hypothetical protein [Oceanisphaera psychrotolerans]